MSQEIFKDGISAANSMKQYTHQPITPEMMEEEYTKNAKDYENLDRDHATDLIMRRLNTHPDKAREFMDKKYNQKDYDLFNSIHYTPDKYGRSNYVEGEEEEIWNKLSEHFDLPRYNPLMYSFGVDDKNKIVRLFKNGVAGSGGFGDWLVKPKDLGQLQRRIK